MTIERARKLRSNSTDAEKLFWEKIRGGRLGYKFRRQVPVGKYIVDFLCLEHKIIVEIDGGQHNGSESDQMRDGFLSSLGFKILRFWNNDVLSNMDGVLSTLTLTLSQRERGQEVPV